MNSVTLRKTTPASSYGAKYLPASYDVLVNGQKVGVLVGRSQGRNGNGHWHEFRDLLGNTVEATVEVRGASRQRLNDAALKLAAKDATQP